MTSCEPASHHLREALFGSKMQLMPRLTQLIGELIDLFVGQSDAGEPAMLMSGLATTFDNLREYWTWHVHPRALRFVVVLARYSSLWKDKSARTMGRANRCNIFFALTTHSACNYHNPLQSFIYPCAICWLLVLLPLDFCKGRLTFVNYSLDNPSPCANLHLSSTVGTVRQTARTSK